MSPEYIDTVAGGADIANAGDPDPVNVSSPSDISGGVNQKVNQKSAPQAKPSDNVVGDFLGDVGKRVGDLGGKIASEDPKRDMPFGQQDLAQGLQALMPNPVDWAKHWANDATMTYHVMRDVSDTWGQIWHEDVPRSIHNIYQSDSAQARAARIIIASTQDFTIGPRLYELLSGKYDPNHPYHLLDQSAEGQKKTEKMATEYASSVGPEALNPLSYLMPEGKVGTLAATVGLPAISGLVSADPNERDQNLVWAAVAGTILSAGHLPKPLRDYLTKSFGRWSEVETFLRGMLRTSKATKRAVVDPEVDHLKDHITKAMEMGAFPGRDEVIAKAAKPGEEVLGTAVRKPEGGIAVLPSAARQARSKLFAKLGVSNVGELVHKAATEGLTGRAAKLVSDNWKALGLPYDLHNIIRADDPLRDPREVLNQIHELGDPELSQVAHASTTALNHMLDQVHRGPLSPGGHPTQSLLRSLAGLHTGTKYVADHFKLQMASLLERAGVSGEKLIAAVEDPKVYEELEPAGKLWVDNWRLMTNALMHQSSQTGYAKNFVNNLFPRVEKRAGGLASVVRTGTAVLRGERRMHRDVKLTVNPEGHIVQSLRYDTHSEAQAGRRAARGRLIDTLMDPLQAVPTALAKDPEVTRLRNLLASKSDEAAAGIRDLANTAYPDLETNPIKVMDQWLQRQTSAIHTHQALQAMLNWQVAGGFKAAVERPRSERQMKLLAERGYRAVEGSRAYEDYLFHPKVAEELSRYSTAVRNYMAGRGGAKAWQGLLDLEGKLVGNIMWMPTLHAVNMASRMGWAWTMNPLQMTSYLLRKKAILPHQMDEESFRLRQEAINAGVMPHSANHGYVQNLQGVMDDALGDVGMEKLTKAEEAGARGQEGLRKLLQPMKAAGEFHDALNHHFWGAVNDFGYMMYHLEKTAAVKHGVDEVNAKLYAARRANSWMGMVRAEDKNPFLHDLGRMAFFAPNWWRTFAELLVPIYRRSGLDYTPEMVRHMAYQQAKSVAALIAFQKVSGNMLNYMLTSSSPWAGDGHWQFQNAPGNQDRLEVTAPWLEHAPLVGDPNAHTFFGQPQHDDKTGGVRTMENPLGRQARDLEMIFGLESGHPDWKPEDMWDGATKFTAARLSPILNAASDTLNVDLYRTASDRQLRAVDPQNDAFRPSPWSLLAGVIAMTPLGNTLADRVAQDMQRPPKPGESAEVDGPFGTKMPRGIAEALGDTGSSVSRIMWGWITGTNPPYEYAEKSRGTPPTDQQFRDARDYQQEYHNRMSVMSAQALGGQMSPAAWLKQYRQLSAQHHARMEEIYKHDPQYVHGAEGMLNDYEGLYDEARTADGSLDYEKLAQLQGQFRAQRSPQDLAAMDGLLRKSDQRYPMLALYHKTLAARRTWEESWASKHGYDITRIRKEASEYSALFNDERESSRYLTKHRDLANFRRAKDREFDDTPSGLMYSLFYGGSAQTLRYMRSHRLTAQSVEQQVQGAA